MLLKLLLAVTLIINLTSVPDAAYASQKEKVPRLFKRLEIKANLGRTLVAVDKNGDDPVFYPIVIINNHTKIYSRTIRKGLWLKPRDIVDVWTDRITDGLYVANEIVLRKRPDPTEEDLKRGGGRGHPKRLDHFRLVPKDKKGYISKVVVDTRYQNVCVYGNDNKIWYVSRCVTGKDGWQIPKGKFRIRSKQRNRYLDGEQYGEDYHLWVNYWMPFYGGAGLHDAGWRYSFWVNHHYYGSHGCVNLPWATARYIYKYSRVGTPVHVR
ncbi:MAG: L,D-transpeptidase [Candidatus Margulisiibacteriota bacterium]